jgi:hypothetical protein
VLHEGYAADVGVASSVVLVLVQDDDAVLVVDPGWSETGT